VLSWFPRASSTKGLWLFCLHRFHDALSEVGPPPPPCDDVTNADTQTGWLSASALTGFGETGCLYALSSFQRTKAPPVHGLNCSGFPTTYSAQRSQHPPAPKHGRSCFAFASVLPFRGTLLLYSPCLALSIPFCVANDFLGKIRKGRAGALMTTKRTTKSTRPGRVCQPAWPTTPAWPTIQRSPTSEFKAQCRQHGS
jgi:hypothetical protein